MWQKQEIHDSFLCKNCIFHQFAKVFSLESFLLYGMSFLGQVRPDPIFGASLSEPHTSMTALQNACVCLLACLLACLVVAIYCKFKLNEQICIFQISARACYSSSKSNSTPMDLLNATEDSSPCNSVPMNLLSARDRL